MPDAGLKNACRKPGTTFRIEAGTSPPAVRDKAAVKPVAGLLPWVAPDWFDHLNRLFCLFGLVGFSHNGHDYLFELLAEPPWGGGQPDGLEIICVFQVNGHLVTVVLDRHLLISGLASEDLMRLPEVVRCAAVEAAMEPLIAAVEQNTGLQLRLEAADRLEKGSQPDMRLAFSLTGPDDALSINGAIHLQRSDLEWLAPLLVRSRPAVCILPLEKVPVDIGFVLAVPRLSVGDLKQLDCDDVILTDKRNTSAVVDELTVRLADGQFWHARLERQQIIIQSEVQTPMEKSAERSPKKLTRIAIGKRDAAARDDQDQDDGGEPGQELPAGDTAQAAPDAPADDGAQKEDVAQPFNCDDLMVDVVLELGRQTLALGALQEIKPGYVFDTGKSAGDAVAVKVNGQCIATGQLVQVGQRIGVRIRRIPT